MPFGAGPRMCPGRYLALTEIKMAMATLLASFDLLSVEAADGGDVQERLSFTMSPTPLVMRLKARESEMTAPA
jgi:cytochrome P450